MKRRTCLPLLATSLGGCGASLWPQPPAMPSRYALDEGEALTDGPGPSPGAPVLLVATPAAAPGFDDVQMRYRGSSMALQTFSRSAWIAPPAELLTPLLLRALQRSGLFSAVLLAPSSAQADLRLETALIRLQQDFGAGPSQLRLGLRALIVDLRSRRPLATREFEQTQPSASEDAEGGVRAARLATARLLRDLIGFCAAALASRPP